MKYNIWGMLLLTSLLLATLLIALSLPVAAEIIHREKSLYRNIIIKESGGNRCLIFSVRRQERNQTCINLKDPKRVVFPYVRMIFAGLLVQPHPQKLLMIGLGGGTIPGILAEAYPEMTQDLVEIDPAVVNMAQQYFDFMPGVDLTGDGLQAPTQHGERQGGKADANRTPSSQASNQHDKSQEGKTPSGYSSTLTDERQGGKAEATRTPSSQTSNQHDKSQEGKTPSDHMRVHTEDGRYFTRRALKAGRQYDLIILDAFTGDYIPEHLMTQEFLTELKTLLTADGVVVANTFSRSKLYDHESVTWQAVFGTFFNFKMPGTGNRVIVATKSGLPSDEMLRQNATRLAGKLAPYGIRLETFPRWMSRGRDWNVSRRTLTDQYSPANLLQD